MQTSTAQIALVLSLFVASGLVRAQQIASIDLSHVPSTPVPDEAMTRTEPPLPEGCKSLRDGSAEGYIGATRHAKIAVEVARVSDMKPTSGSDFWIEVHLKNTGERAIKVPWSTAAKVLLAVQDPRQSDHEVGWFGVYLNDSEIAISPSLYSSSSVKGSDLEIPPGRWITVRIEVDLPTLPSGDLRLSAHWFQAGASYFVTPNCESISGSYMAEYKQKNPVMTIHTRR